jgi:hypothetical protein
MDTPHLDNNPLSTELQADQGSVPPRPKTFEAHGQTWTLHIPGDPMPCEGEVEIYALMQFELVGDEMAMPPCHAKYFYWSNTNQESKIVGWRLAEPHAQIAPLQNGDVALVMTRTELRVLIDMVFTSWKTDEQFALLKKLEALRDARR